MLASDYGLVTRRLALDVEYEDSPSSSAHAKVPVFPIGREQLYEMFGLYGYNKSRSTNYVCNLEALEDCIQDCHYVLVCNGHWLTDGTLSKMVALSHAFETLEQCFYNVGFCLELDAWDLIRSHSGLIYDYEVWQICDDYNLYARWDRAAESYMRESCQVHAFSQAWRLSYEDNADWLAEHPTKKSSLMSDEYIQRLKDANLSHLCQMREASEHAERLERCSVCNAILYKLYKFYIDNIGLVCRDCFINCVGGGKRGSANA